MGCVFVWANKWTNVTRDERDESKYTTHSSVFPFTVKDRIILFSPILSQLKNYLPVITEGNSDFRKCMKTCAQDSVSCPQRAKESQLRITDTFDLPGFMSRFLFRLRQCMDEDVFDYAVARILSISLTYTAQGISTGRLNTVPSVVQKEHPTRKRRNQAVKSWTKLNWSHLLLVNPVQGFTVRCLRSLQRGGKKSKQTAFWMLKSSSGNGQGSGENLFNSLQKFWESQIS